MLTKNNLISFLIYICLINLSFNPISSLVGLSFLIFVIFFSIILSYIHQYLLPFYIYPFMFLIQNQDPENIIIKLLPELSILIASAFFLLKRKIYLYEKNLFFFLILFSVLICFASYLHILQVFFIPALIRQYILPVIFLIIFINASLNKNDLPFEALKICIYSFSIISVIALLNQYELIEKVVVNESLRHRYSVICLNDFTAILLMCTENNNIARLDPLVSGSVGSAAAILLMLGIVSIYLSDKNNNFLKYFSLPLFGASILTLSVSILFPIIYFCLIILLKYKKYFKILLVPFIFISFLFLTNVSLHGQESGYKYFESSILTALYNHFKNIELVNVFFGSGPIIDSNKFKYFPENFIIDVGIFRVLLENGLLIFVFFAAILFYFLKKNYLLVINLPSNYNRSLLFILLVLSSMVHSNWLITPPFMVVFAMVISGILVQYKLSKGILI